MPYTRADAYSRTVARTLSPALSTSCPAPGTARAASMPSLTLGSHANLVYIVNEGTPSKPTAGTLKRVDVVTGAKVEIVKLANTVITEAQVSSDGQWLMFVAQVSGQFELQLVRMDGQDLQTLFCSQGALAELQWSATQRLVVFLKATGTLEVVSLLDVTNGTIQTELQETRSFHVHPRTWLDTKRVYLTVQFPDGPPEDLAILDTNKGPNQQQSDLQEVFSATPSTPFCWDFDSSFDASQLFISQCTAPPSAIGPGPGPLGGPSVITTHPPTGGSYYTYVFVDQHLAITSIRAVTSATLLFTVRNETGDTGQNGLWKVGTDGSHPAHLTPSGQLNSFTQFPWSNVSRDGSKYALQIIDDTSTNTTYTLEYGSLSGGTPTIFASMTNVQLATVGWTTM
jgi:eukaryotic-like serine/threonine-protein kinase